MLFSAQNKINNNHYKIESSYRLLSNPSQSIVDINNITSWIRNDGFHDWIVANSWNGSFPNETFVGSVFSEGMVWGGKVNDGTNPILRVNGNTYSTGCGPITRLYRVRPDYLAGDLTQDASNFFNIPIGQITQNQIDELRQQYLADWYEWPADEGAPYNDVDENGVYNPDVDIPGVTGSSQTLFVKYDDELSVTLYGSPQIGINISETYWAYAETGPIGNVIFKKIDLEYVGNQGTPSDSFIDSMYICQWADPDVGNSTDDFAGCDTALNLGYSYNASSSDTVYQNLGLNPPAIGYAFLQGVAKYTGNASDSAIINFKWRNGYKYSNQKPMSSFIYYATNGTWWDPAFTYTGTQEFYNIMRGFLPDPYYPASDPFPSDVADYTNYGVYLLSGDPVAGTGKIDGLFDGPGDRRIVSVSGPFHLSLGQSAEVVVALVSGLGNSYLNSVTKLKENTITADTTFLGLVKSGIVQVVNVRTENEKSLPLDKFNLFQNYPNPFNPATNIAFLISNSSFVTLKVYDIIGNEVATLMNEEKTAGEYEVHFDASKLASGIYFYQLKAGSFVQTKKMILLK